MDLTSFGYSLIPAAVGAAAGGPAGGALGLASGIASQEDQAIALQKANADIAFRNIAAQQKYQEYLGDQEYRANQNRHWQAVERQIDDSLKTADLNRQKMQQEFDIIARDDKALQEYARANNLSEADRLLLKNNPNAFAESRWKDETALNTAASALSVYKLDKGVDAKEFARAMGPKAVQAWILNEQKHQQEMQQIGAHARTAGLNRYGSVFSPEQEGFFITDRQTGGISFKPIDAMGATNPTLSDANRTKAINELRRQYEFENKDAVVKTPYEEWAARPENKLKMKFLTRQIKPDEYEQGIQAIQSRYRQDDQDGFAKAKQAWGTANGITVFDQAAEARWERYRATPEGAARVKEWQDAERKQPSTFKSSSAAPAKKDEKRPSLDSIF